MDREDAAAAVAALKAANDNLAEYQAALADLQAITRRVRALVIAWLASLGEAQPGVVRPKG